METLKDIQKDYDDLDKIRQVLLETDEKDTAILIKYHPEWNKPIRRILNEEANKLLDSLLEQVTEDDPEILKIFNKKLNLLGT
jgi:DNA-binding MarR family transcriptional regulator